MKFLLSFCFILTLTSLTLGKSMTWGKRNKNDRLLYRENVVRYPLQDYIQEVYVTFPKLGAKMKVQKNVTAIYVFDRFTNSSGAVPIRSIPMKKSNNARFNSTIVILKSKRSKGINSTVEFYGN
ncbi:uncharacterized protein LOC135962136 [Calliphora vicina]|uniref:uncharacterized protein LOC135962136 n=1 Tax=Calliphora vicina TaxID=7373 RepID=UPI00325BCEF3